MGVELKGVIILQNCFQCALGKPLGEGKGVYCHKFGRLIPPEDAGKEWGCNYFTEHIPEEGFTSLQYLLLKENEIASKK
ncbi:MAG: Uncharacterized protein XD63_1461 [Thermoanaerobacterales bacterium 50_218]|nr:MAG: Uncharacterized protein XD63_1461 [Thermoanaerobacterales bacterium 50_218]HAA89657.1 hypothetical protein [Peptococcaceae bacterium]